MTMMPKTVAAVMPPRTTTPRETWLAAPAPLARTRGSMPRMKLTAVISTAR